VIPIPEESVASWFETRGVAALLTMRVQYKTLILRRREAPSRRVKAPLSPAL